LITVRRGELAVAAADAVLRPVSAEWDAPTPAARRLEQAAGPDVEAQCRRLGELPVGSAAITGAGDLDAQFLVHAVVRSATEPSSAPVVRQALRNGLRRAVEWGIDSIAMPPLGTGAGNLDAEDAARVMVAVMTEHMREQPYPSRVEIVVETEYELTVFEREVQAVVHVAQSESRTLG
jgi:O-acetyl-ADP-ribose deacetylase (regulator of RNase III)